MARLEDYELGRVLARGGMGVVHEAIERSSGRHVVPPEGPATSCVVAWSSTRAHTSSGG